MFPLFEAVNIPFHAQFIDEDGVLQPNEIMEDAATAMLDELVRVEAAMRASARHTSPSRDTRLHFD
jgi:hypothetical protein